MDITAVCATEGELWLDPIVTLPLQIRIQTDGVSRALREKYFADTQ